MGLFAHPLALALGPLAVLLLWLLERWRRRPPRLVVADPALFEPDAEVEAEARTRRRRAGARWLLRAGAALLMALAAAGPRLPGGAGGPLLVDLVLDRGPLADARDPQGAPRLAARRAALEQVLARLRPDDRVRLHLLPAGAAPAPPPLSPASARAVLARAGAVGAPAGLAQALAGLAGNAGPPVFVATGAAPQLPPALAERVRLAGGVSAAGPLRDRALVSLAEDEQGAVWVGVVTRQAPGPADLTLRSAAGEGAEPRVLTRRLELPADGETLVRFDPAELQPPPAWVEARLDEPDDLPLDDGAAAVREVRPRAVGVVGDPGPWVRRALRAVPGVILRELPRLEAARDAGLDLVVAGRLQAEEQLPGVPLAIVPPALPAEPAPGGELEGVSPPGLEQAFARTLEALGREPPTLARRGELPALPAARPLLRLRDGSPVAVVAGEGRRLVVAFAFPLLREVTTWTELPSFPLFWAELLRLVAPRGPGHGTLQAHPAGQPWEGPEGRLVPLLPGLVRGPDGAPLLGTVATLPEPEAARETTPARFDPRALEALEAARPAARERPLAAWCLLLGAGLALLAWRPERR